MGLVVWGSVGAILFLICLSAFFSGSETALTAASKARMTARAKEGNGRAVLVNNIRDKKDRMIGALLLGNNLVNILASALATSVLIKIAGEAGVFYATALMTLLVLIFAEVLPETYALHKADEMSMAIAPVINIVVKIFAPITEMVTFIVRFLLRLCGVDVSKVSSGSHVELLRGVIEMHQGPEDEVREQRAMLRSILDLADVDVEGVMVHRRNVFMVDGNLHAEEIVKQVLDSPYTRIPVWKDDTDNIVGVLHVKTLLKALQAEGGSVVKINIDEVSSDPWFVPETTTLSDQLQEFRSRREHFALVVDEYGSFMGVVSLEDILEEIVGDVEDEYDVSVVGVKKEPNGILSIDGSVAIRDLNREFEWSLPSEDYVTLAGLILHESQMVPDVGQVFNYYGFDFEIIKRQRNQITLIRVTPPIKEEQTEEDA